MGKDSSVCWERAYTLTTRGIYLPEYPYEDWACARRRRLEGLLRDCVQHRGHILRQAGYVDEAILRLRMYWEEHPTDEDALRPLLEMLGEHERYQEAETCYETTQAALFFEGSQLDLRTVDMLEYVRALPFSQRRTSEISAGTIPLCFAARQVSSSSQNEQ